MTCACLLSIYAPHKKLYYRCSCIFLTFSFTKNPGTSSHMHISSGILCMHVPLSLGWFIWCNHCHLGWRTLVWSIIKTIMTDAFMHTGFHVYIQYTAGLWCFKMRNKIILSLSLSIELYPFHKQSTSANVCFDSYYTYSTKHFVKCWSATITHVLPLMQVDNKWSQNGRESFMVGSDQCISDWLACFRSESGW